MSAIENLFRAHAGQVHRYAQRHVGLDSADDVVAETFVVVLRRIDHVPHEALPWLLVVARNIIRNHQRHLRRQRVLWSEVVRDQWSGVSEAGADEQVLAREEALAALGQCTPSEREALLLTAWDGLDLPAAALVAGCSTRAFTVRLSRARARFDRLIQESENRRRSALPACQRSQEKRR